MKKTNFFKMVMTLVLAFVITGAFAQTYPTAIATDYVEATENTLQTTGYGLTLYVAPDPAFSPDYDGTDPADINSSSEWVWTVGGTAQAATPNNYVVIAAGELPAAGSNLVVDVEEGITGLSCTGTTSSHTITVVGAPTADISATPSGTWDVLTVDEEWQTCTDGQLENISIAFTESGVTGGSYAYKLDITTTDYDAEGVAGTPSTTSVGPAIDGTLVASSAAESVTFNLTAGASRTKYEIALQAGSIGSQISRVSQYRANAAAAYSYYNPATTTLTFWVNAAPTTGPIYHIPNNFTF